MSGMTVSNQGALMDAVLQNIAEGHSIKDACNKVGCPVGNHYYWIKNDPAYQEGFKLALRIMAENIVLPEMQRRAVYGVEECKTFVEVDVDGNERITGKTYHRKFPDAPLMAVAKAQLPEMFTERKQVEITDKSTVSDVLAAGRKRLAEAMKDKEQGEEA